MEFTTHFELHSQATRLVESAPYARRLRSTDGILTLCDALFQGTSPRAAADDSFYRLQFGGTKRSPDLQHGLFPLHSPLLGESLLVSFPPLSNMLKSSGSSYLIRGPKRKNTDKCILSRKFPTRTKRKKQAVDAPKREMTKGHKERLSSQNEATTLLP